MTIAAGLIDRLRAEVKLMSAEQAEPLINTIGLLEGIQRLPFEERVARVQAIRATAEALFRAKSLPEELIELFDDLFEEFGKALMN